MKSRASTPLARTLGCSIALSLATAGCVLPPAPAASVAPAPPPTKYYVASVDTSSEVTAAADDGLKVLDKRATTALAPGITVAFFPPNACRSDVAAASTTASPEAVEIANECGVLISALETSVADRYSVVSWQTLKGADPFARAEARKVDVIFEVDSMGLNALGQDSASQLRIDFYEQTNATDRVPVALGPQELPAVAQRCKAGVEQLHASQSAGTVGSYTGAIKAVDVKTGQALVYYQRTLTDDPGGAQHSGFDLYFEARGRQDYVPPPVVPRKYNGLQVGGVLATAMGGGMVFIGTLTRVLLYSSVADSSLAGNQPGTAISAGVLVAGIVVFAGGITMLAIGNSKAKKTPPPAPIAPAALPPPSYQPPAAVLCGQSITPPWLQGPTFVGPAPAEGGGSSYSFSETQTAGHDAARERENRLRKLVIDDFTKQLAALGGG